MRTEEAGSSVARGNWVGKKKFGIHDKAGLMWED